MARKAKKPRSSVKPSAAPAGALLRTVVRGFFSLFQEELPVTEFKGRGKCDVEVAGVKEFQQELEAICGGRGPKAHKLGESAILRPGNAGMVVQIRGREVGYLKPKDSRFVAKLLDAAEVGRCALRVPALVLGGRRKRNGEEESFSVKVCLPPRPEKPQASDGADAQES